MVLPFPQILAKKTGWKQNCGLRHEKDHLATPGAFADLSDASLREQVKKTTDAIAKKVPILYQAAFLVTEKIGGTDVEIVGVPCCITA